MDATSTYLKIPVCAVSARPRFLTTQQRSYQRHARRKAGDFCTLDVETVGVMPGNGGVNLICALNTKQVYRANGEDLPLASIDTEEREGKKYLA